MSQEEASDIDDIFKRIFRKIQDKPFVVDAPSEKPFNPHKYQTYWEFCAYTSFTRDELNLQYLSFLTQDASRSLLRTQHQELSDTDDPKKQPQHLINSSNRNKKKISLADYKKKVSSKDQNGVQREVQPTADAKPSSQQSSTSAPQKVNGIGPKLLISTSDDLQQLRPEWGLNLLTQALERPMSLEHQVVNKPVKSMSSRIEALGKALKKKYEEAYQSASDRHANAPGKGRIYQSALVIGVESVICYMAFFSNRSRGERNWPSLYGLQDALLRRTEEYPHLHGLCHALNAASALRLQECLSSCRREDLATEEDLKKHFDATHKAQSRISSNVTGADKELTGEILERYYPKTFELHQTFGVITMRTTWAIRLGMAFLREWTEQQNIEWEPSFDESLI